MDSISIGERLRVGFLQYQRGWPGGTQWAWWHCYAGPQRTTTRNHVFHR